MLTGVLLFLAIGLPWYVYLFAQSHGVGGLWLKEVTRRGATGDDKPDAWYTYFVFLPLMLPWAVFFVVGLIGATRGLITRRGDRIVLALMLLAIPVLVMSVASPDRKDRYLLPMVGPSAVLAAWGIREVWRGWSEGDRGAAVAVWAHWVLLAAIALALPLVGAMPRGPLRTGDGGPWYSWNLALPVAAALAVLIAAGVVLQRRRGWGLVPSTAAVMLVLQALAMHGYARSPEGLSGMKRMADAIWTAHPEADAWFHHNRRAPNDLAIYLDRPTPQIKDLSELRATDRPQVVVMIQKEGHPPPRPPAGWRFVTKTERDRDWLHAFVLPSGADSNQK